MKWHTEKRRIGDLIPTKDNPRTMTKKQDSDLGKSLDKFDLVEIPAINKDGQILAGHQRIRKLIEMDRSDETIDVRVPDRKLTKRECEEYLIRSNRDHADWNFEILSSQYKKEDLEDWGFEGWEFGIEKNNGVNPQSPKIDLSGEKRTLHKCPQCKYEFSD